jgi:hypothetical protein
VIIEIVSIDANTGMTLRKSSELPGETGISESEHHGRNGSSTKCSERVIQRTVLLG